MDTQDVKKRLRSALSAEGISNKDIASKISYSEVHVGKSLSLKHDVITQKFITKLFEAFPEFAAKHKEHVLSGAEPANLFNSPVELAELRKQVIEQKAIIAELREQIEHWRDLFASSLRLHPDLVKLINPFAQNKLGADLPVITGNMVHKGAMEGAYA